MMILDETLKVIRKRLDIGQARISDIYLSNYYNIVQLNDSSVGCAMTYHRFGIQGQIEAARELLMAETETDPLLLSSFAHDPSSYLTLSLKTAVISALSEGLILRDESLSVSHMFSKAVFSDVRSATIVGFGGYMDYVIRFTGIERVHIIDLLYEGQYDEPTVSMKRYVAACRRLYPQKQISISRGLDTKERIRSSDLVSITASAFCNGTMEELLDHANGCKRIIIQGQSGLVYPTVLFDWNVSLISTTLKPRNLLEQAMRNPAGAYALLEGKLSPIHITLRSAQQTT